MEISRTCPFCLGDMADLSAIPVPSIIGDPTGFFWVMCDGCGARGPIAVGQKAAVDRWNNRAVIKYNEESDSFSVEFPNLTSFLDET